MRTESAVALAAQRSGFSDVALSASLHVFGHTQPVQLSKEKIISLLDDTHFETIRISDTQTICIPRRLIPKFNPHTISGTLSMYKTLNEDALTALAKSSVNGASGPPSSVPELLCVNDPPTFYWKCDDGVTWARYKPTLGVRIRDVKTGEAIKSVECLKNGREYRMKNVIYEVAEVAYGLQYVFVRVRDTKLKTIIRKGSFGLLG